MAFQARIHVFFRCALFQAVAVDIDKEEEALRSGIERSALALKSRLEQPLMKNDSMDSTETGPSSDSASACTTQPLGMSKEGQDILCANRPSPHGLLLLLRVWEDICVPCYHLFPPKYAFFALLDMFVYYHFPFICDVLHTFPFPPFLQ